MTLKPRKQDFLDLLPSSVVVTHQRRHGDARYLTFDDGPNPQHTPRLLDLLARHGIKASFFVVGQKVERHPDIVARIVAEGHMLGNHSYSHWSFKPMTQAGRLKEIRQTDELLQRYTGQAVHRMRPPAGQMAPALLWHFALNRRNLVHWSYDSLDYQQPQHAELVARLLDTPPAPGDIILMHDDNGAAVDALAEAIPVWLERGYTFLPLAVDA
jgi:peptidoglycan-N-acetylglucosamine deacetylase